MCVSLLMNVHLYAYPRLCAGKAPEPGSDLLKFSVNASSFHTVLEEMVSLITDQADVSEVQADLSESGDGAPSQKRRRLASSRSSRKSKTKVVPDGTCCPLPSCVDVHLVVGTRADLAVGGERVTCAFCLFSCVLIVAVALVLLAAPGLLSAGWQQQFFVWFCAE